MEPALLHKLMDALKVFDILDSVDLDDCDGHRNVLLSDVSLSKVLDGKWEFTAKLNYGGLVGSHAMFLADDPGLALGWNVGPQVTIHSDVDFRKSAVSGKKVLLGHVRLHSTDNPVIFFEKETSFACWWNNVAPKKGSTLKMMDVFCGAYGGWAFAQQWLASHCDLSHVAAIDHSDEAVETYRMNHGGSLIKHVSEVDSEFHTQPIVLRASVSAESIMTLSDCCDPNLWTISAPCPPWSRAGVKDGLFSEEGVVFAITLALAKLCRPFALLLENVYSLVDHAHFPLLMKVLASAGYKIVWQQRIDVGKVLPATRYRWIALAVDSYRLTQLVVPSPMADVVLVNRAVTVASFHMVIESLPVEIWDKLIIDDHVLNYYSDPNLAKAFDDVTPWCSKTEVLRARLIDSMSKCRTFMAQYGKQHQLPPRLLEKQGLLGQLLKAGSEYRFVSPQEVAFSLGTVGSLLLPLDVNDAWLAVGNAISPIHAGIAFVQLLKIVDPDAIELEQFLEGYLNDCMHSRNTQITVDGPVVRMQKLTTHADPDEAEVEATAPFQPFLSMQLITNDGCRFISTDGTQTVREICLGLQIEVGDASFYLNGSLDDGDLCNRDRSTIHVLDNTMVTIQKVALNPEINELDLKPMHTWMIKAREYFRGVGISGDPTCVAICSFEGVRFFEFELRMDTRNEMLSEDLAHMLREHPVVVRVNGELLPRFGRVNDLVVDGMINFTFHSVLTVLRFTGGGQTKKQTDQERAIQHLVTTFTAKGLTVPHAMDHARKIIQKMGTQTVLMVFRNSGSDAQWKALREEADARAFELMPQDQATKSARKIQELIRRRQQNQKQVPSIRGLTIQSGWFLNDDDSPAQNLSALAPGSTGVALCDVEQVKDYLHNQVLISTDEMVAVVPWKPDTKLPRGNLEQIPVVDKHGSPAIITAAVIQLGEKNMKFGGSSQGSVETEPLTNALFTLHRHDFDDDQWAELVKQPVKTALAMFEEETIKKGIVRVWSRLFLHAKAKCEPQKATLFSFQACIRDGYLPALLQQSGLNKVFMRPSRDSGSDDRFVVVWAMDRIQANTAIARLPSHKGLVFNNKNYGVRMMAGDVDAAHKVLNPGKPTSPHVPIKHTYKMSPLPKGITVQALENWSNEMKWSFKPLRRINDHCWLVGAPQPANEPFLSLQGRPVLLEETKQVRNPQKNPIVAGTLAVDKPTQGASDPWLVSDPWSNYKQVKGTPPVAAPARTLPGPAQAALTEQSTRMDRFEQELQTMKASQDTMHAAQENLKVQLQEQGRDTDTKLQKLEASVVSGMSDLSRQVQKALMDHSQTQDQKLGDKFDELKALLKDRTKRKADQRASPLKDKGEGSDESAL